MWLKETYEAADKNGDGSLSLDEVIGLVKKLNMGLSIKQVKRLFMESDTNCIGDEGNTLDLGEFRDFYKAVSTREEIYYLMMKYSSSGQEHLTPQDLVNFLETEQKIENVTEESCKHLIAKYEPTSAGKEEEWLGVDGFSQLLLGPEGQVFNPEHNQVHQDMTQPLSHYFINSSHNTYLTGDQFQSKSSVDMYIKVLKTGCKCIELDCWDGPEGEPMIYHGYTLTSKVKFWDVIQAIEKYAFVISPYPVILSIENHCSVEQQEVMAQQMHKVFRDHLLTDRVDPTQKFLPSPEQLQGKILIKNKKLSDENADGWVTDEDEGEEDNEGSGLKSSTAIATNGGAEKPKTGENGTTNAATVVEKGALELARSILNPVTPTIVLSTMENEGEAETDDAIAPAPLPTPLPPPENDREMKRRSASVSAIMPGEKTLKKKREQMRSRSLSITSSFDDELDIIDGNMQQKRKLHRELSKLVVYTQSTRFRGFRKSLTSGKCYELCSFGEGRAQRCVTPHRARRFVRHNVRQLSRIYPAGYRINSSNYSPIEMWNSGCQLVALNFQKNDKGLQINSARFKTNGNCGYVLKPEAQRTELMDFNPHSGNSVPGVSPVLLAIKIISGQQLPKPNGVEKGEIIDPYVKVEVLGIPRDCAEEKTKFIDDNGFNPIWNETFTFTLLMPELALIRFVVMDKDVLSDDYIGQATFPVTSLLQGYRHVNLDGEGTDLATLFLHISLKATNATKAPNRRSDFFKTLLWRRKKADHEGEVVLLSKRRIGSRYDGHPTLPEVGSGSAAESGPPSSREVSPGGLRKRLMTS
ncbi:1-phosphatidylinositol 4,5-bisphosphate phosphodiesterase eta-2-like [Oscarella lobularis]|uniref:1-phosphatidylinositol 4,5-bisphosphate phosphodiesterase eta-2-like n=1 Tax=Oscarella lobularis TaxID=121494 RepID=UPI0033143D9D